MRSDVSHISSQHDLADELADNLSDALDAIRNYRDRCLSIIGLDQVRPGDEAYLAGQLAKVKEIADGIPNSLYLLG
jgi:CxxC motif-containing protein (DUF1111 family)